MSSKREINELKDKVKFNNIQQLHNSVLQFSQNTMEIKKLFISVLIAFFTIITGLGDNISISFRVQILILIAIVVLFWFLDAQSYYYQKKLRYIIEELQKELKRDESLQAPRIVTKLVFKSLFNSSMFIYYIVFIVIITIALRGGI